MNRGDAVRSKAKPHWGTGRIVKLFPEMPELVRVRFDTEYTICDETRHDHIILTFHTSALEFV